MKKKLFLLVSLILLGIFLIPTMNMRVNAATEGNWVYEQNDEINKEVRIIGYLGTEKDVKIPNKLGNLPVTMIDPNTFEDHNNFTTVTIPSSISDISTGTFKYCNSLQYIYVDQNNKNLSAEGGVLFSKDKKELIAYPIGKKDKIYNIPDGVTTICSEAFLGNSSLTNVTIPESVTDIGSYAFTYYTNLRSVVLPNGVATIENSTFSYCYSLSSIKLPSALESIAYAAFEKCKSLTSITIPDSVVYIEQYTFSNCTSLTSVGLSKSLDEIKDYTFIGCKSLKTITFPDSVKVIGFQAFQGCINLESVTSFGKVEKIDQYAFGNCVKLSSITLPSSLKTMDVSAFSDCSNLSRIDVDSNNIYYYSNDGILFNKAKSVLRLYPANRKDVNYKVPSTVKSIGSNAFNGCRNITSITIPEGLQYIGDDVFLGCDKLESINVSKSNKVYTSKDGVLFDKKMTELITYPASKKASEYAVPKSIRIINSMAFMNCKNLKSVVIPQSVKSLMDRTFAGCKKLTNISLPSGLEQIDYGAFSGCISLKSITIPRYVKEIDEYSFRLCTKLSKINVDKRNKYYSSKDGVLFNKKQTELCHYPIAKTNTSYTVPSTVIYINQGAFADCKSLKKLVLSNKTKVVYSDAFYGCKNLKIVMSGSVKHIYSAFGKNSTVTVYAPDNSYAYKYAKSKGIAVKTIATKVSIKASKYTIKVGKTLQLKAILNPTNNNDVVRWTTNNKNIATVSSEGVVKAEKAGKVTITVYTISNVKAKITLVIKK